jgi:hypothetical protein
VSGRGGKTAFVVAGGGSRKVLRKQAGRKSAVAPGRALKRSEAAVRFRAHSERISLTMK